MSETAAVRERGRPKSVEKREAILGAARALLLEHGYTNTSMDMVAEVAGVGKPTVYSHFGSKEDLVAAVIAERESQLVAALGHLRVGGGDTKKELYAFACRFSELILNPDARLWDRLVIAEAGRSPSLAQTLFKAGPVYVHSLVKAYIEGAVGEGTLVVDDASAAAEHLIGLLLGLELLRGQMASQSRRTKKHRDARAKAAVDAFMAIYGA